MLPLELKYYKLDVGESIPVRDGDVALKLYQIVNKDTGVVESEHTALPDAFRRAITQDRMMERVNKYLAEEGLETHLDLSDEEEDTPGPGIMVPQYMAGGGKGGPGTPPFVQ